MSQVASQASSSTAPRGHVDGVLRACEHVMRRYRRTWRAKVYSSFLTPLLTAVAMGAILGGFIKADPASLEGAETYLAFVVPGLLAAHAMQTAAGETTYPVLGEILWNKTYHAAIATPVKPEHIVGGHLLFCLFRLATVCGVYAAVMIPFGVYGTWWSPLASWLSATLTGMAFCCAIYGFSTRINTPEAFAVLYRFGVVPMSLFAGAFFPVANLGAFSALKWIIPLWHGVNLTRMSSLATWDWGTGLLNIAVLLAACFFGTRWSMAGLRRRLIT